MALDRRVRELVKRLRDKGWRVRESQSGPDHFTAYPPDAGTRPISFSGSGDPRAFMNVVHTLRRHGFSNDDD